MKQIKKGIVYALTGSMLFSSISPAMAYTYKDSDPSFTVQDVNEDKTSNTTVYAEVGSTFKVTIPKHIILNGTTKSGAYTVSVEGDIAGTETVNVVPDEAFFLKSNNLKDVIATIDQDKVQWKYDEILEGSATVGNGAIDASDITAGSWNGNFNFNINLKDSFIEVEAKDQNGTDLNAAATLIEGEEKETLLNSLVNTGMIESADEVDALIDVDSDNFEDLADTTFNVSNIANTGDTVVILHFNEETSEWEYIGTETVDDNGEVKGDFTSYSPVAFIVVDENKNFNNIYTLTFNANGGSCTTSSIKVAENSAYGTLPTPTRSGYTFLGWYTATSGGIQVTADTLMNSNNTTVHAQWKSLGASSQRVNYYTGEINSGASAICIYKFDKLNELTRYEILYNDYGSAPFNVSINGNTLTFYITNITPNRNSIAIHVMGYNDNYGK